MRFQLIQIGLLLVGMLTRPLGGHCFIARSNVAWLPDFSRRPRLRRRRQLQKQIEAFVTSDWRCLVEICRTRRWIDRVANFDVPLGVTPSALLGATGASELAAGQYKQVGTYLRIGMAVLEDRCTVSASVSAAVAQRIFALEGEAGLFLDAQQAVLGTGCPCAGCLCTAPLGAGVGLHPVSGTALVLL